ncbi:MAG: HlyD family secretion protein [Methylocystis sp.]|nr:HlyD family secretion protein [Methylocystis sp.]MCA3582822.1 HlyD family secretion protein [Methylocystis sp.]MCA3586511.1 HlyD family secretion protein [Methylocystis sp.]MCA3592119.1 HlyD family secretion protein [Methylocystis sp.]
MLELMLCSLLTIFPDYLFRRYGQGKRLGKEITLYSVWFELRWGLVSCLMLTVAVITTVFYNHPSTSKATAFFRTVPIAPEAVGRVAQVYVGFSGRVAQGEPLFRLDSARQEAELEVARRKLVEIDAALIVARTDIVAAEGKAQEAKGAYQQAVDELVTKQELQRRNPGIVAQRDIERLEVAVSQRAGALEAANAATQSAQARVVSLLPAERASAEAALTQAQVELDKMVVRAGVTGRIEQFSLKPGDIVNPMMRPAGLLIPEESGRRGVQAGFSQLEAQIIRPGMIAEVACVSKPWTIIPMVVTQVQDYIAAGQIRAGEQLFDAQQVTAPGTLLVFLEPLFENGLDGVTPGSSCVANAYSSNYDKLASPGIGMGRRFALHAIDALGLVHAMLLRINVILLPIKALVLGSH